MFPIQDQISVAARSHFEAQLALLSSLTSKTFESVEKIVDLNLSAVRASLQESSVTAKKLLSARDPQELVALTTSQTQPNVEKVLIYGRSLTEIASATQSEFSKAAEAQLIEVNRKIVKLVEDASKNAPPGSENMVAIVKSAIDNANNSFDQITKTGKQAVAAMEANIKTVAHQAVQANGKQNNTVQ